MRQAEQQKSARVYPMQCEDWHDRLPPPRCPQRAGSVKRNWPSVPACSTCCWGWYHTTSTSPNAVGRRKLRPDITRLALSTPTLKLATNGTAALGTPSFEGLVALSGSPRKSLESLGTPVRTADPKALDALDLKLDVQAAPAKVDVRSITGKLDDTAIQGKASAMPPFYPWNED